MKSLSLYYNLYWTILKRKSSSFGLRCSESYLLAVNMISQKMISRIYQRSYMGLPQKTLLKFSLIKKKLNFFLVWSIPFTNYKVLGNILMSVSLKELIYQSLRMKHIKLSKRQKLNSKKLLRLTQIRLLSVIRMLLIDKF